MYRSNKAIIATESKIITNISVAGIVGAWCVAVNIRILITLIQLDLAAIGIILTMPQLRVAVCAESTIQNGTRSADGVWREVSHSVAGIKLDEETLRKIESEKLPAKQMEIY